jgi:hypothetical protein
MDDAMRCSSAAASFCWPGPWAASGCGTDADLRASGPPTSATPSRRCWPLASRSRCPHPGVAHLTRPQRPARQDRRITHCRASFKRLADEAVVTKDGPHPTVTLGANGTTRCRSPEWPCHKRASHSGPERFERPTTKRPRPAPFPALAGTAASRTGFGSRGGRSAQSSAAAGNVGPVLLKWLVACLAAS